MENDQTTGKGASDRTMVIKDDALPGTPGQRKASLVVLAGWEIGKEIDLSGQEHVIGRSLLANTRINAPSVSREHAKIVRIMEDDGEHFVLTDLKSSNGTRVNSEAITSIELHTGDKIQMGDVVFKFVIEDEVDAHFYQNVHRLIHYDQLTGLLKMDAFRRELDAELHKGHKDVRLTLAMTDLDGLKRVNDTHGHLAGRMVVREMGVMIRQALREQDRAGLYGGDETVIFYPDTPIATALEVAERLRTIIEARVFEFEGTTFGVTISQGLAEWPRHGKTVEEIIAAADKALYEAKAAGRNCSRCAPDA